VITVSHKDIPSYINIGRYTVRNDRTHYEAFLVAARESAPAWILLRYYPNGKEGVELIRFRKPPTGTFPDEAEVEKLEKELDTGVEFAKQEKLDAYVGEKENGHAAVFVRCKDGYIGCGVFDAFKTRKKAPRIATAVLFELAHANIDSDEIFANTSSDILPDVSGSGFADATAIESFIAEACAVEKSFLNR
jgi:hypothetical protein